MQRFSINFKTSLKRCTGVDRESIFRSRQICENSIPPIASGKITGFVIINSLVPMLSNVFTCFERKAFCMFNANKVFVLYCIKQFKCLNKTKPNSGPVKYI